MSNTKTGEARPITVEDLSKLINDYISAQAERDARRDEEAERGREEAEKNRADFERRHKLLQQDLGKLGHSYGDQIEAMFVNLGIKFNALGYSFPKETKEAKFRDENGRVLAAVDRLLENHNVIMPIEVKAKLKQDDVDGHIRRLGIISEFNVKHKDNRKVHGAVAGGVVPENVMDYAQNRGLYVLVQNGESVEIADMPADFEPREW